MRRGAMVLAVLALFSGAGRDGEADPAPATIIDTSPDLDLTAPPDAPDILETIRSMRRIEGMEILGEDIILMTPGGAVRTPRAAFDYSLPTVLLSEEVPDLGICLDDLGIPGGPIPTDRGFLLPGRSIDLGAPGTASAVFRGERYLGTCGRGLFRETDPETPVISAPEIILSLLSLPKTLLMGTDEGLVAWDGKETRHYEIPGPPDDHVTSLARTSEGLWVGTFDHGLALLDDSGEWRSFTTADGLPSDWINALAVLNGTLYVGTGKGLAVRREAGFQILEPERFPAGINALRVEGGGLYVAVTNSIHIYDGLRWRTIPTYAEGFHDIAPLGPPDAGMIAAGGLNGILLFDADGTAERFETVIGSLPDDWVTSLHAIPGDTNHLLVGLYDHGLGIWSPEDGWSGVGSGNEEWITPASIIAANGRLIAGTEGNGAVILGPGEEDSPRWILPGEAVTAFLEDEDGLWVGTRSGLRLIAM